jgi:hypothetical protein
MNSENERGLTYEQVVQRRLDAMAEIVSWWQRTTHEEHVDIIRAFIDYELTEAVLADARIARANANAA